MAVATANLLAGETVLYYTTQKPDNTILGQLEAGVGKGNVQISAQIPIDRKNLFDRVISLENGANIHSTDFFADALRILKPSGKLIFQDSRGDLKGALIMAGFVDISTNPIQTDVFEIVCFAPQWEVGVAESLATKTSKKESTSSVWTLDGDDMIDTDVAPLVQNAWESAAQDTTVEVDLMDEDALLADEDLITPSIVSVDMNDDCDFGTGATKKACKNCSCGRAEIEKSDTGVVDTTKAPQSSCGSCYLGDAFRCGSCPYKGLPPFKPGDKVTIKI
eukprot:TRINITY_DN3929_c0_g1_i1.p1 TRINITY_DN3929_c0_g1~~TRINITY_DN3929_c0_g1_i1.p1  ORF type:complete len:277 (+),score=62.24 TRINITY_DN3929_c0_g1_i1:65-895(+)